MTLIQDVRVDRAVQFGRRHLKAHLSSLALFDRNAAAELLRLDAEAKRLDDLVASSTHAGTAKSVWIEATSAAARGVGTLEQQAVAGQPLEVFRASVVDRMHQYKSSRSVVRDCLRKSLRKAFLEPGTILHQLANEVEDSYSKWCQKWGVTADRCTLAHELRHLAGRGWEWGEGIGSSPLADGDQVRKLLEDAAQ